MSFQFPGMQITFEAGADLSTKQFFAVAIAADQQVDPSGAGLQSVGVLQNKPSAAGRAATVMINGVTKASAGAAIAVNDAVAAAADGQFVTAAPGDIVLGIALEAAAAADEIIAVLLGNSHSLDDVVSLVAGADLSTKQFLFMAVAADAQIDPAGDGVHTCGVLQNVPSAAGQVALCKIIGITSVISGAAFTAGDPIGSDAAGKCIEAVNPHIVQGIALATAGGADETISLLRTGSGNVVPV